MSVPARAVLERAAADRALTGTENRGSLSERHGLLPMRPPSERLPDSHRAWDEMAARLPELFTSVTGRELLDAMAHLPADEQALPGEHLLRAASLLGHFAHAYVRVRPDPPARLPDCIAQPWGVVSRRLGRPETLLTYDDLVTHNWRFRDPAVPRCRVEDLEPMTRTVCNREEHVFYMAQVEIIARSAPMVGAMVRAQEAAVGGDEAALAVELATLIDALDVITSDSFLKIDPNPHSPTHVDPVVWAKTVAPFGVGIESAKHAISGAAATPFQVLDVFIGRRSYDSVVGRESLGLRAGLSPNVREFIEALGAVSVERFAVGGSPALRGLWSSLLERYCGDRGFLGVHRRKAYAFLEIAFKVGRSVTTGGFSGVFEDQTWKVASAELERSRLERWEGVAAICPVARSQGPGPLSGDGVTHVRLDVAHAGLRFRPGDHLAVLPRNSAQLVERTLRSLGAGGDELVALDGRWRLASGADRLTLRELVERGRIRPVARHVAKSLLAFTHCDALAHVVDARTEGDWELWDLLDLLTERGFDPRALWQADAWEPHALVKLVAPESHRYYSIASAMDGDASARRVELLAAQLRYESPGHGGCPAVARSGTASSYLAEVARHGGTAVPVRVVPSTRFRLPEDPARPLVMFAGGAGISTFRAFLDARAQTTDPGRGAAWLLLSTRSEAARDRFAREATGVRFDAVVTGSSRHGATRRRIGDLLADHAAELSALATGTDAVFFVCGPAGFAASVIDGLEAMTSRATIRRMIGERRLQQDVFTSAAPPVADATFFDASDVATRNDERSGYWTIIDGAVYDVTEFAHRHPGGSAILREVAGRDATTAYRQVEHDLDPSIEAQLAMYQIGNVRRLAFGRRGAATVGDGGLTYVYLSDAFRAWARYLHLVVEIENAVRDDFWILDAVTGSQHDGAGWSFLKAQLLLETQQRFGRMYLRSLLGPDLQRLWMLSCGMVAPHEHVHALRHELERCAGDAVAAAADVAVGAAIDRLRSTGRADAASRRSSLDAMAALRAPYEHADLAFLAGLKRSACAGVRLFETYERDTAERAGQALLDPLRAIPPLVARLHASIAAA